MNSLEMAERMDKIASNTTFISSGGAVVGGLTLNNWLAIGGLVVAVVSLLVDIHFKRKKHKLLEQQVNEGRDLP